MIDDHGVFRGALEAYLARDSKLAVVASLSGWAEFLVHPDYPADVVLLDLDLQDDIPATIKIRALVASGARVVVVSSFAEAKFVLPALRAGVHGFVPKRAELREVGEAVTAAARGDSYVTQELACMTLQDRDPTRPNLSDQELRILALYAAGLPLKSAARRAGITYETAKTYLGRVRGKYDAAGRPARSKIDLRRVAVEDGVVVEQAAPDIGS